MANRFWVGGTGTWDASDTTHWASTTGGAGGASVPGSADVVTFDASSGAGTVTVNTNVNVTSIIMGAFGGTLDFDANNNTVALVSGFSCTGSGARTFKPGTGTWTITLTSSGTPIDFNSITNLSFNPSTTAWTVVMAGSSAARKTLALNTGITINNLTLSAMAAGGTYALQGPGTIGSLTVNAPNNVSVGTGTITLTNAPTFSGASSTALLSLQGTLPGTTGTIASTNGISISWASIKDITITGGALNASSSFDNGHNTLNGGSITGPSTGSSGPRVIGG